MRVAINPKLLRRARERSRQDPDALAHRFPRLNEWESGKLDPTLKQLERFADAVHAPIGYFFLPDWPVEQVPIPDFRTVGDVNIERPSPDLLEMIYICQQRQEWYRDFLRTSGDNRLPFVGSATLDTPVETIAATMRRALHFDLADRARMPTWTEALRLFIEQADAIGILIMVSGVVGSNNRRKLDPNEFRGFALCDDQAPLVFINGSDTKSGQMFTLAHELAHIWLGQSALSDIEPVSAPAHVVEKWCNRVAAELLVPLALVRAELRREASLRAEMDRLARRFKVSTLVVLRRVYDAGGLTREQFRAAYRDEVERLLAMPRGTGGDFYLTQAARVGKRFARALVASTLEGQTLHRDAFRLLGFSKFATFRELGRSLGIE